MPSSLGWSANAALHFTHRGKILGAPMMHTCTKLYTDFPCAQRLAAHDGECRFLHGHNLGVELEFGAERLDDCGFVIDFGKLEFIGDWLRHLLDHALLLEENDPLLPRLKRAGLLKHAAFGKVRVVPSNACERLAEHIFHQLDPRVRRRARNGARLLAVTVIEDSKNRATFRADV